MQYKSFIFIILVLALGVFCGATVVHFVTINDCHSVMESYGPRNPLTLEGPFGGYARAVTVMDSLRALYPNILAVHAGDLMTGDMLTQATMGRAVFDLWLNAGVKAICLGNHEFDYGPELLDSMLGTIDVPLVCANLDATGYPNLAGDLEPYRIFAFPKDGDDDSIHIALIGALTEEVNMAGWISPLAVTDPIEAIEAVGVPSGADCAIALEHLDITEDLLSAALPNISAVIGGHDHSTLFEPEWVFSGGDSTPVVMAGSNLRYIGHLTMEYIDGTGLRFVDWDVIPIVSAIPENPLARERLNAYRDTISAIIGLDPYTTVAFTAESSLVGWTSMSEAGFEDTPLGNIVTDAYLAALGTDISVEARGSLRMSTNPGPVTCADLFRAMPMSYDPNKRLNGRLVRMEFSGTELIQLLEYVFIAAAIGPDAYPQFGGMQLSYNPDGSFLNKIDRSTFYIGGELWSADARYSMATNEMVLHAFEMVSYPHPPVDTSDITAYEAIVAYCRREDFVPVYHSVGRLINLAAGLPEFGQKPCEYSLSIAPNPFNSTVRILFDQAYPTGNALDIEIFDIAGRRIDNAHLDSPQQEYSTAIEWIWTPKPQIPSGVYLVRAKLDRAATLTKRIVLLK